MNDDDIKILENLIKHTLEACKCSLDSSSEIESLEKEAQAIENLLNRNKELEEIEQEHKKENGELREKVKELEEENAVLKKANNISENVTIKDITNFMNKSLEDFNKEYIPVSKIKEIVDECIPRGKNIITGVEEYQPNANANSYLAQEVLKLLEGK